MIDTLINLRAELPDDYDYNKLERKIEDVIKEINGKLTNFDIDEV